MFQGKKSILAAIVTSVALMVSAPAAMAGDDAKAKKAECKKEAKAMKFNNKGEKKAWIKSCVKGEKKDK